MNNSKTYTISEDLYKAIIDVAYQKGYRDGFDSRNFSEYKSFDLDKNTIKINGSKSCLDHALKVIEDQQYIYEN